MSAPMCRSRTEDYLAKRRVVRRRPPPPTLDGREDFPLMDEQPIGIQMKDCCMPEWVDALDEIRELEVLIQKSMQELEVLHKKKAQPSSLFSTQEDSDNVEIQMLSAQLSGLFKKSDALIKRLGSMTSTAKNQEEEQSIKNVQVAAVTKLNELSTEFRTMQRNFLKAEKDRRGKSLIAPSEEALRWEQEDRIQMKQDALKLKHKNLTEEQIEMLKLNEELVEQRDQELNDIMKNLTDIHEMFMDLNNMVINQGTMLDRVDQNITKAHEHIVKGVKELRKTETHAKNTRFKLIVMLLLFLILLFFIALVVHKS
eukprot:TRINITY_DN21475_c0_g1_i1.p1 TRINITY_DN21475_c0_g1~~TRINITY_DN21475_c0_g1_i1.p1  ORF type:complete len:336 (+),score=100.51 TRINITY_DN21475_c0_g1_i1:74-1009(+)